jgi:hypothetical protein
LTNIIAGVATDGFKLFINNFGTSDLTINSEAGDGTNGVELSTQTNFATTGEWKHLAFVVNKNEADGQRALFYFNGAAATQSVSQHVGSTTTFPSTFNTSAQLYVGVFKQMGMWFAGEMDDMRIYNWALDAENILQISQQK